MCRLSAKLGLVWVGLLLLSGEDTRALPIRLLGCQEMISTQGLFTFVQLRTPQVPEVCLTMFRAPVDMKIEVRIQTGNVSCDREGEIAFIDGLNLNEDYFPGIDDGEVPASERMSLVCDTARPLRFVSNQNVATVLFRFPKAGRRFTIQVRHIPNPEPCNVVAPHPNATGLLKLQNFGQRRNCSYLILYPTEFAVLDAKLGRSPGLECARGSSDFFEIRSGGNIDPLKSTARVADSCQLAMAKRVSGNLGPMFASSPCFASVVRLVSSGRTDNVLVVKTKPMDLRKADKICPAQ